MTGDELIRSFPEYKERGDNCQTFALAFIKRLDPVEEAERQVAVMRMALPEGLFAGSTLTVFETGFLIMFLFSQVLSGSLNLAIRVFGQATFWKSIAPLVNNTDVLSVSRQICKERPLPCRHYRSHVSFATLLDTIRATVTDTSFSLLLGLSSVPIERPLVNLVKASQIVVT